ncbi:hypothetical protein [Neoaquamicrobium sediminum]|uniref:Uncharacterized protein n=1 Tax=Neoaquamicrobium sediminum TaxID=1849104 RepID=A0ABV3WV06_9HYPH
MVFDHIEFGRPHRQRMRRIQDDAPALSLTLPPSLLAGAAGMPPRPFPDACG